MGSLIFETGVVLLVGAVLALASVMWWRWIVQYNRRLFGKEVHAKWPVEFEWRRLEWDELTAGEKLNQASGSVFFGAMAVMTLATGVWRCVWILVELVDRAL